jgi:Kef-type K+ transport system membrane component KefB
MLLIHTAAAAAAVLLLALAGRWLAQRSGQPPVVGEVAVGLAVGPAVVLLAGRPALDVMLPDQVLGILRLVGEIGLVLFMVGVAHHIRPRRHGIGVRMLGAVTAGAAVLPLAAGGGLATWLVIRADDDLRGDAPSPALILMVALAFTVTAVPVLARILQHHGLDRTPEGLLAMTSAIVIDALMWVMLAVALTLVVGGGGRVAVAVATLVAASALLWTARSVLTRHAARFADRRHHGLVAVAVAAAAVLAAAVTHQAGLTVLLGAVLVGLAIPDGRQPDGDGFAVAVNRVVACGTFLMPLFFVTMGIGVLAESLSDTRWALFPVIMVLAVTSKILGTYLAVRLIGLPGAAGIRLGVLMNTRGLTEIAVLHAGLVAGIVTPTMFVLMVVMALATTVMTSPLLALMNGWASRQGRRDAASNRPSGS